MKSTYSLDFIRYLSKINILNFLSGLVALVLIGFTFYSLHFGLPWTDEASHILPSYKFLLGQTPFVDEYNSIQLTTILTFPVFKLFYFLNHSHIEGIFIFERRFYTVVAIICCAYLIRLISFYLPLYLAILIAINLVSFTPFGLHSPSYDNFVFLFLTLGFFSLFRAVDLEKNTPMTAQWMFLSCGIWLGLVASIYPPLGLCWVFIGFAYPYVTIKKLKFYLLGLTLGVSWLILVIAYIGLKQFLFSLHASNATLNLALRIQWSIKVGGIHYYDVLKEIGPFIIVLMTLRLLLNGFKQTLLWQLSLIISVLGLLGWIIFKVDYSFGNGMGYTVALFLAAPFLYCYLYSHQQAKSLFYYVWIPSFLACLIMASVSSSEGYSTVIAAFSGGLVSLIFALIIFRIFITHHWLKKVCMLCLAALMLTIACGYQFANLKYFYSEALPPNQYCFDHGALKSLCSSQQSAQLIAQIEQKLQPLSNQNKTLSIFASVGIGYFLNEFNPLIDNAYPILIAQTVNFYKQNNRYPDIILTFNAFPPYWGEIPLSPAASKLLSTRYQLYSKEKIFSIYKKLD